MAIAISLFVVFMGLFIVLMAVAKRRRNPRAGHDALGGSSGTFWFGGGDGGRGKHAGDSDRSGSDTSDGGGDGGGGD